MLFRLCNKNSTQFRNGKPVLDKSFLKSFHFHRMKHIFKTEEIQKHLGNSKKIIMNAKNIKWKQQMFYLCFVYLIWQISVQWMIMLWPFLQWDAEPPMDFMQIGVIHGFGSFCNMIGAFVMGQIIDTYGIRSSFLISVVLTSIYFVAISKSTSFWAFMTAQVLRIGFQFEHSTEMYVATTTSDSERTNALLKLGMPVGASLLISPFIAGKLSIYFDLRTAQLLDGIFLLFAATPIVLYLLPETHDVPARITSKLNLSSYGHLLTNRMLVKCIMFRVALTIPMTFYELITRQFMMRDYVETANEAVWIYVANGAAVVAANFLLLEKLQRNCHPEQLIRTFLIVLSAVYFLMPFVSTYNQFLTLNMVQVISYSLVFAEICAQSTSCVEKNDMGKAIGLGMSVQWMVQCVVPVAAAVFVQNYDWKMLCYVAMIITLITIYFIWSCGQFINRRMVQLPLFQ